jgi:hypothetical protein
MPARHNGPLVAGRKVILTFVIGRLPAFSWKPLHSKKFLALAQFGRVLSKLIAES